MLSNRHISQNYCRNTHTGTLTIFSAKGNGQETGVHMLINKICTQLNSVRQPAVSLLLVIAANAKTDGVFI